MGRAVRAGDDLSKLFGSFYTARFLSCTPLLAPSRKGNNIACSNNIYVPGDIVVAFFWEGRGGEGRAGDQTNVCEGIMFAGFVFGTSVKKKKGTPAVRSKGKKRKRKKKGNES